MSKLLIDGDVVVYRCGFAVEKTKYLAESCEGFLPYDDAKTAKDSIRAEGGLIWSRKEVEPVEHALALVKNVIKDIQDRHANWSGCHIYLSPSVGNFREQIATRAKYKGNRDANAVPVHHRAIREYLVSKFGAEYTVGQEADDAIGIAMSSYPGSTSVSVDKDLLQLPGRHYNWVDKSECTISKKEGALNFWSQVLSGDSTDNVPGIEGVGPVKSGKMLEGVKNDKEAWEVVQFQYADKYGNDGLAFAIETAKLVYVRRKAGEVWEPPK